MTPRFRISRTQRQLLQIAAERGWTHTEDAYRYVLGLDRNWPTKTRLSDSVKSSVVRSLRRLTHRGLLDKKGPAYYLTSRGAVFLGGKHLLAATRKALKLRWANRAKRGLPKD